MKKCLLLLLTLCISFSLLSIGVAAHAEEEAPATGLFNTSLNIGEFVSLCIAGVLLIVVIVLCIIKRKKLAEALRAYRSEMKKITWYSWKNVVRGTVFVLVTMLIIGAITFLLDLVFFELQNLLVRIR